MSKEELKPLSLRLTDLNRAKAKVRMIQLKIPHLAEYVRHLIENDK